ncbi:MAG: DUF3416 domain-containing protein, partial [Nitrospinae bacterium]|nr:DUF3416 domain-containing protein [Nitrospinota bacterium]
MQNGDIAARKACVLALGDHIKASESKGIPEIRRGQDRSRVVIENVKPEIDAGRFPIKRTLGESVFVEADMFVDGHEALSCV